MNANSKNERIRNDAGTTAEMRLSGLWVGVSRSVRYCIGILNGVDADRGLWNGARP
jgi:hypothetical protein